MDRLTEKMGDRVLLPIIPMEIRNAEDLEKYHDTRRKYEENTIRLAEYEDTGLTPEQIREIDRLYEEKCKELTSMKAETENYINDQPKSGEWILCSERLPEVNVRVLTTHENGIVQMAYLSDNGNFVIKDDGDLYVISVVAWQPLPEPYKESD